MEIKVPRARAWCARFAGGSVRDVSVLLDHGGVGGDRSGGTRPAMTLGREYGFVWGFVYLST